ncbi:MAG: N-acetylmuramoyl-L-alanine amidase CwlD [Bacilli bacterium]|nr:N-acetylmuramoyl-L-alanine amidase CwlD [Bacilli bacterium]
MRRMKYKISLLVFLLLVVFSLSFAQAHNKSRELPLFQKVITIDPGHGGRDPGTRYGKILEKDLNLEISKALEKELTKQGAIVFMTRDQDEDLSSKYDVRKKRSDLYRRIKFIEKNKSDLYLSIHLNWYRDYYYGGVEVLYNNINKDNKRLSEILTSEFSKNKIKTRKNITTDLYLYRNTRVPGVLIECGFLSNKNDRYLLQTKEYQKKISKIITRGVINYLKP